MDNTDKNNDIPSELTPEVFFHLGQSEPAENAAGIKGVLKALQYGSEQRGIIDSLRLLLKANQVGGFDCPSCAWPDPDREERSSIAEYCENGAKAITDEATKRKVTPAFFRENSVEYLSRQTDYWLNQQGRITEPMILRKGATHYEPIAWQDAFALIGENLKSLPDPNKAVFYTSGRTSNEAAFMYQLFIRQFGTNNLPDCSNMCHESSGSALSETLGIGKGSILLEDLHKAELVLIVGQNPGTNHPRMLSSLKKCKDNGGVIVSINPLKEAGLVKFTHPQEVGEMLKGGTAISDFFVRVRINGDVPLFKAVLKLLCEKEERGEKVFDKKFIAEKTIGFEEFLAHIKSINIDEMSELCGVPRVEIEKLADLCAKKEKIVICWAMGLTQHKNAVDNIRELVNLLLLRGSIGKEGAGTCPVRGHSNVQGDRTMGIWEKPKKEFLQRLEKRFDFKAPYEHGYDVVAAIKAMHKEKGHVFIAMGGNFLSATPDTSYTAEALRNCKLTVQVSTKLNRSHLITGETALILPCLGRTEIDRQKSGLQFVTVENSMGYVHQSQGTLEPISPYLLSEPAIVAGMAKATLAENSKTDWQAMTDNYDLIREHIEACIDGFENFNERVKRENGFYLPNCAREGNFNTESKKAKFTINALPDIKLKDGEFLMMTVRTHDQFNTVVYGLDDRYRGIYNERRIVMMNKDDMLRFGFREREIVDLLSEYNGVKRWAKSFIIVSYDIPSKCLATYFPEANTLVPITETAHTSHTPISKSVVVRLLKK
jgi:molybdopterin-dependent oxidoreductase alpha subunit